MENIAIVENAIYVDYNECIRVDLNAMVVALWNKYLEFEGRGENKISLNNKEFFENSFNNAYDAAWAATISGKWRWSDDYVYFNGEGFITSFSHWDDETSPIDLDKIDVSPLIDGLKKFHKKNKKGYVNNIPKAIHEALQEV